jgi:IPT/TIG domain
MEMEGFQMKNSILAVFLLALSVPVVLRTESASPQMTSVEPGTGVSGDVLTVTGERLDQTYVAAVYLTDGKNDIKVVITEQTATSIKFQIPTEAKAGRFALMVLTSGKEPKLIEEPVKVTVESPPGRPAS